MNTDIAKGKWNQLTGKVKQKWGKLTDDEHSLLFTIVAFMSVNRKENLYA